MLLLYFYIASNKENNYCWVFSLVILEQMYVISGVEIRRTCRTIGHFLWMSDKKCWSAGPNVRQKL